MRLQLTVVCHCANVGSAGFGPVEVEVDAADGSTARELAEVLTDVLVRPPNAGLEEPTVCVAGSVLDDDAPLGREPLVDGVAISLVPRHEVGGRPAARRPQRTPVALAVTHGPDAGRSIELAGGEHTLGRSPDATICLDDSRASRLHASVMVSPAGMALRDLGSTNGTYLDDLRLGSDPVPLVVGAQVQVGDTLLVVRPPAGVPAAVTPRSDGTRAVNRRPRLLTAPASVSIALPTPPEEPHRVRVPWIAMVVPVPFAAVMALFFGPTMLVFALMSPLLMAGTALSDRVGSRRRYAAEHAAYLGLLAAAHQRIAAACTEEVRLLRACLPDPAEALAIATMPTARIWERRRCDPDVLTVGIGRCTSPAALRVVRSTGDDGAEHPVLHQVPCELPLARIGVMGLCGQREDALGVLRVVLGQLTVLHSPLDLDIVLIAGSRRADNSWSWLGRLPHVRRADGRPFDTWVADADDDYASARVCIAELARLVCTRRHSAAPSGRWTGARTVVVLDGSSALRSLPDLAEVLQDGPSVGITVIALDADREGLPSEASGVLDLVDPTRPQLQLPGSAATDLVVDRVGAWWADRLSRGLAPLRDATPGESARSLPPSLGLVELLQGGSGGVGSHRGAAGDRSLGRLGPLDPAVVVRGWGGAPHRTSVPVGVTAAGTFTIDLASDGPHILIAGTTGAGKSELLRTLVASLAVHNRPEHLSLVLIDYKGGAAFRECDALPHVAGVVTDLDDHLADRAITSLTAELKRRERLLDKAGTTDFLSYQSCSASQRDPMARLVIVIDEFRALAEELPQLIDGMVRVAALGRSLGVHVVLATQRPAGVVTAEIKANVNLRIALRVRDRMDSEDVIEAPDAAALDRTIPGRGCARSGGGASLVRFQAAYSGGRSNRAEPRGIRARRLEWDRPAPWPRRETDGGTVTDLGAVVSAVCEAAATVKAHPAPTPWLAALPSELASDSLPRDPGALRVPIGLADEPAAQRQRPVEVDLATPGHWGLVGGPGSGRSTALMTLSLTAASMLDCTTLHLYAVSGGSLTRLSALPHCGAHVDWDDLPRLERLVARLSTEVADRRRRLAASSHATIGDWWRTGEAEAPPVLMVVVDDWEVLAQRTDEATHGALVERLLGVLREGAGVGLTGAVAGDRALLVGRAGSVLAHRVLLRLADRGDAVLAGVAAEAVPRVQPPGRGVLLDGTEVQLALPPPHPTTHGDVAVTRDLVVVRQATAGSRVPAAGGGGADSPEGPRTARPRRRPWRVEALPRMVEASRLPMPTGRDELVYLGLGGDDLSPLGLSPGRDGRRWVVGGGHGSGVTTSLVLVAADALRRGRRVAVVARPTGPWAALRQEPGVLWCDDPAEPGHLVALRREVPDLVVVVDDADELLDSPVESVLKQLASLVDRDGGLIAAGASSAALSVQYRGLAVDLARHRTGVLLGPSSPVEADVFGVRVAADRGAVPGRGYLVRAGVATALQVAMIRSGAGDPRDRRGGPRSEDE